MTDLPDRDDDGADPRAPADDSRPLRDLRALVGRPCSACAGRCSPADLVRSIALGFRDAPRCLACLADGLGRVASDLRAQLDDYIHRRECYRRAWDEALRLDAADQPVHPVSAAVVEAAPPAASSEWDAGDMACGELVLALRVRLAALPPGAEFRLRATDPAAPEDIPAWCRLTGHRLLSAGHPLYLIRRKGA